MARDRGGDQGLACKISVKSKSKNSTTKREGYPPISLSKAIIAGQRCAEAWKLPLRRIHEYKPGGLPPEWKGYPQPRIMLGEELTLEQRQIAEVGH